MVPYCDLAIRAMIASTFASYQTNWSTPAIPVVLAPPESSRQALAAEMEQANVGIPGISIFRTACTFDPSRFNQSAAWNQRGFQFADNTDGKTTNQLLKMPVIAHYTAVAWARDLSTISFMERILTFLRIYNPVTITINTSSPSISNSFDFQLEDTDPLYSRNTKKETGEILWYNFSKDFMVPTNWVLTSSQDLILSITVSFKNAFGTQFEEITINPS